MQGPTLISKVEPEYTEIARKLKVQGTGRDGKPVALPVGIEVNYRLR